MSKEREVIKEILENEKINKFIKALTPLSIPFSSLEIEKYDEYDETKIEGRNEKKFYRLKQNKALLDLIKKLKNNSSYVSYMDEVLKYGIIPENLSVMLREIDENLSVREVVASQILALFGCNTPLYFRSKDIKNKFKDGVITVDFMRGDKEFKTFEEIDIFKLLNNDLDALVSDFYYVLMDDKTINIENKEKVILEAEEQLVMSYLVRRLLFCDSDFFGCNIGFQYDNNRIDIINYDFECSFDGFGHADTRALDYTYCQFNNVYERFIDNVELLLQALKEYAPAFREKNKELLEETPNSEVYRLNKIYEKLIISCKSILKNHENRLTGDFYNYKNSHGERFFMEVDEDDPMYDDYMQ